ncbi:MAG TPA: hypothetical protein VMM37_06565 [Bacteroidota bacterium]|nr:hypothetical protein [Bacteroidota bacterium]
MNPKTKTLLLILLCFALGAIAGVFGDRYFLGNRAPHHPDPAQVRKEFAQRLHLDSTQVLQVDSIFDVHRKKMDDIRKLFTEDRDSLRAGIRKLLSPDQSKLYDDYVHQMESRDTKKREPEKSPSR